MKAFNKNTIKKRRMRVRGKVAGSDTRPRISVFRSNKYFYAQAINDEAMKTVAQVNNQSQKEVEKNYDELGEKLADKLKKMKITNAVFDTGRYRYKGNIQKFADGLRSAGITI